MGKQVVVFLCEGVCRTLNVISFVFLTSDFIPRLNEVGAEAGSVLLFAADCCVYVTRWGLGNKISNF